MPRKAKTTTSNELVPTRIPRSFTWETAEKHGCHYTKGNPAAVSIISGTKIDFCVECNRIIYHT